MPALRASTEHRPDYDTYRGVLRDGPRVVWRCGCQYGHQARDNDGRYLGQSARSCAFAELQRRVDAGEATIALTPPRRPSRRPSLTAAPVGASQTAAAEPWLRDVPPF